MVSKAHFDDFKKCLQEERFYDAHEALEEVWFPKRFEKSDELLLIKGFINASVSFELIKRGRIQASLKVWKNYEKYIVLMSKVDVAYKHEYEALQVYVENLHHNLNKTNPVDK